MRATALLAAAIAAAALSAPAAAAADEFVPVLPDLVADPPGPAAPEVYDFGNGERRLLLRFDGYVHNAGAGALELRGSKREGSSMTRVEQRLYDADGKVKDVTGSPAPQILFEQADGHNHWHLRAAARYSLWNHGRTAEVAPAQKVGFCLVDSQRVAPTGPDRPVYTTAANDFCAQGDPEAANVFMGVSAGWRDIYGRNLYFQWVDISEVQPGPYVLRSDVDPEGVILEADEVNPAGWATSTTIVNGHLATPFDAGEAHSGEARSVTLQATTYDDAYPGSPGAREFRIETPPAHGTLSQPTGRWFAGPSLTYTAAAGYTGPDSFTFSARDATSPYPLAPAPAAVSLTVGASSEPSVTISGAPERMYTGSSAQLTATVVNAPNRVEWYVDGKRGGDVFSGRITTDGLYTAPLTVPRLGYVTVSAVQPDEDVSAHVRITIEKAGLLAMSRSAPSLTIRRAPAGSLAPIAMEREGDVLVVGTRAGSAGVVVLSVRSGDRRRRVCRVRAPAGRAVVCKLSIGRRMDAGARLRLKARLHRKHRLIARRRALRRLPGAHRH